MKQFNWFQLHPLLLRILLAATVIIFSIGALVGAYLWQSLPVTSGQIETGVIAASVTISRDDFAVPTIEAANDLDAYRVLGFVHAQDRLWQMDMHRRLASGRLSEIAGEQLLPSDSFFRTLGLYRNAQKIWKRMSESNKQILQAYVNGVNLGIHQLRRPPVEYALLGVEVEAWTPEDSIVLHQLLAWQLSSNMGAESLRARLIQRLGLEPANQLMPAVPASAAAVTDTQASDWKLRALSPALAKLFAPLTYVGSNSWVVSGKFTRSGGALLANDPHLPLSLPSIWYLASLKGQSLSVSGATLPGLPFVVIGRNAKIAWGLTTMMADTQDVVLERLNPRNPRQYWNGVRYEDMVVTNESIRIKQELLKPARPPVEVQVRRTSHGPLLSDVGGPINGFPYSVRWTGDDDDDGGTIGALIRLNYASNWQEFNDALSTYVAPIHNFVYADTQGNIGFLSPGKFPIRSAGAGSVPAVGWNAAPVWSGWIPYGEVPRRFNPAEGYIVTANNKVVDEHYPYHITHDWVDSYRADRIAAQLRGLITQSQGKLTYEHMRSLQLDTVGFDQMEGVLPALKRLSPRGERQAAALALVRAWDGEMGQDSVAATVVTTWLAHLNAILVQRKLGEQGRLDQEGKQLFSLLNHLNYPLLRQVLGGDASGWCGAATSPPCRDSLFLALERTLDELSARLGADMSKWQWGKLHKAQYPHFPFSEAKLSPTMPASPSSLFARLFHRELPAAGADNTINVAPVSLDRESRYLQFYGATYRQIVDLKDGADSWFSVNTGESGNPFSAHYFDLAAPYARGDYLPMAGRGVRSTLILKSVSKGGAPDGN